MPIMRCTLTNGKQGWKFGTSGKCYDNRAQAEKQGRAIKANEMITNLRNVTVNFNLVQVDQKDGADYYVVPIIALVEGVHHGSGGAGFYSATEISRTAQNWNGVPLTVGHPRDSSGVAMTALDPTALEKYAVGTFENVHYEEGKLKGEGWINKDRIGLISAKTLNMIMTGVNLEVSTGLYTKGDKQEGIWKGERFEETVSDFVPDHLALLPDAEGACNFAAGCGVRANVKSGCGKCLKVDKKESVDGMRINITEGDHKYEIGKGAIVDSLKAKGFWVNELSHSKTREQLFQLVSGMDKEGSVHFLREVFDKSFVFEEIKENNSTLFRQGFKIDSEDVVSIKGSAQEVREEINFIPINNSNFIKEEAMKRSEQVDTLIANEKLPYTDEDREMLTNMAEESFDRTFKLNECGCEEGADKLKDTLTANAELTAEVVSLKEKLKTNSEKKGDDKEPTFNELLEKAKPEDREAWNTMITNQKAKKDGAVEAILKIKENKFSKETLEAMSINDLENIIALTPITANYGGNGSKVNNQKEEVNVNERQEDGSGVPLMPEAKWNADGTPDFSHLDA